MKFHQNMSSESCVVPCGQTGQTEGHDKRNSSFSKFCEISENRSFVCYFVRVWIFKDRIYPEVV